MPDCAGKSSFCCVADKVVGRQGSTGITEFVLHAHTGDVRMPRGWEWMEGDRGALPRRSRILSVKDLVAALRQTGFSGPCRLRYGAHIIDSAIRSFARSVALVCVQIHHESRWP